MKRKPYKQFDIDYIRSGYDSLITAGDVERAKSKLAFCVKHFRKNYRNSWQHPEIRKEMQACARRIMIDARYWQAALSSLST